MILFLFNVTTKHLFFTQVRNSVKPSARSVHYVEFTAKPPLLPGAGRLAGPSLCHLSSNPCVPVCACVYQNDVFNVSNTTVKP